MLIYCIIRAGKTPSQAGALKCCCVLPLKRCVVQPVLSQGVLRLSCHGETLILFSACVDDTKKWLEALQQALKQVDIVPCEIYLYVINLVSSVLIFDVSIFSPNQYHANLQTLRKDSSSRRPMRRKDILKNTHESPSQLVMGPSQKRCHPGSSVGILGDKIF